MLSQGKRPICARLPLIKDLKDLAPEALLGLSAKRFARCLSTRLVVRWNGWWNDQGSMAREASSHRQSHRRAVAGKYLVGSQQHQALRLSLRHQHPVERIAMDPRHLGDPLGLRGSQGRFSKDSAASLSPKFAAGATCPGSA